MKESLTYGQLVNSAQWHAITKEFAINCELTVKLDSGEVYRQGFVMDEFGTSEFQKKVAGCERTIALALAGKK